MAQPAPVASSAAAERRASAGSELSNMHSLFERAKLAFSKEPYPTYEQRMQRLEKLLELVRSNKDRIAQAISADFSARSVHETKLAEIFNAGESIKYMRKHLRGVDAPESRHVP